MHNFDPELLLKYDKSNGKKLYKIFLIMGI